MSDFKAKYQALQILQRLASGEKLAGKGRGPSLSPRKPGVKNSDDILKEKYTELAELVALQHLEKQAVSALQNMYVSPPKRERRSRRRKRDGESRRRDKKEDGLLKGDSQKQRPLSASSSSSHSSTKSHSSSASFASRTSSMSNSSRSSSMSHDSRASSGSSSSRASCMSKASRSSSSSTSSRTSSKSDSSRSSTKSKSSSNPKPVERHFVTIVEEEEEEEIINQDDIKERQIAKFDEELAQENAEGARREKEASKRTRRVSFVLETQEESSEDEVDVEEKEEFVLEDEEPIESRREKSHSRQQEKDDVYIDAADPTPRYIEIENSLLREILSPRSPRRKLKLSPRSDEKSPTRDRSKSPKRKHRSPSPRRAWEGLNTVPLPPRPVKDAKPCDHKLSNTDNPEIRKWLRHKNALIRRERRAEVKKEREERRAAESASQKKVERLVESEEYYDTWVKQKVKVIRKLNRNERRIAKEEKRRQEEEKAKREELFRERQRQSVASFGEVPSPRGNKIKKKRSAKASGEESYSKFKQRIEKEKDKNRSGNRTFPSSNPLKGLTYDEWMRQKMASDQANRKKERQKQKSVPDPENIIPNLAKERIERAKSGKGKRVNTGLKKERDERPECDRTTSEKTTKQRPYTWTNNETSSSNQKHPQGSSDVQGRAGLQRPSTAKNHIRNASDQRRATLSRSDKGRLRGGFSPSSARPEPQGSESNDDHSEHGVKIPKGKPWHGNTEGNNNNKTDKNQNRDGVWDKALVKRSEVCPGGDTEDSSIFLTEFDG